MEDKTEPRPEWGQLPVERFILTKWDTASPLSDEQQRARLLVDFIENGAQAPSSLDKVDEWDALIQKVLIPWRSQRMRRAAEKYNANRDRLFGEFVVLRTYYGGGTAHDDKLHEWLEECKELEEDIFGGSEESWWRILDDSSLFDMGEESWDKIYEILPELVLAREGPLLGPAEVSEVADTIAAHGEDFDPIEDDYEEAIMGIVAAGAMFLLVIDEEAFEEEELLLVWRDKGGNVVKQRTLEAHEVANVRHDVSSGALFQSGYWEGAETGTKYKTKGELMRVMLPLVQPGAAPS